MILFFWGVVAAVAPSAIVFGWIFWNDRKYAGRCHSDSPDLSFGGARVKRQASQLGSQVKN